MRLRSDGTVLVVLAALEPSVLWRLTTACSGRDMDKVPKVKRRQRAADAGRYASDCVGHTAVIPSRGEDRDFRARRRV